MAAADTGAPKVATPIRLWPGVVLAVMGSAGWFGVRIVAPDLATFGMVGAVVCGLGVLVWWTFFSRAPRLERMGAVVVMVVAMVVTSRLIHVSIANGMMGLMLVLYGVPSLSLALVVWAFACRRWADSPRRVALVAAIVLASGAWSIVRTDGVTGGGASELTWRWTKTSEERLLEQAVREPAAAAEARAIPPTPAANPTPDLVAQPSSPAVAAPAARAAEPIEPASVAAASSADWPGFRGANRDGIVRGLPIATNWAASPPTELWRRPIGPGWSSLAVRGDRLYTQEQRGEDEVVSCYSVSTGKSVWTHRDPVRFWESNAGAGPRATPSLDAGRVYAFGATGILNALDAASGAVVWSHNVAVETGAKIPTWGYSNSPLVIGDLVIVHAGVLVAYDRATGARRWIGQARNGSYSSPQLLTIGGVAQILMMDGAGATSVAPSDGAVIWEHAWPGASIVQSAMVGEGDVLITTGGASGGAGIRRLAVMRGANGWTVQERWTSVGLKPYFNDFVVHKGHAYGFDGSILSCIDLETGKRVWKGGRYGNGQLVLLPDQDALLVLSEEGEFALVGATPTQFTELARHAGIDGKTWNHPVLVGDVLLVRNGQEMAAFRLPRARQ
jgi:outer membrane protein assembly factor BamB